MLAKDVNVVTIYLRYNVIFDLLCIFRVLSTGNSHRISIQSDGTLEIQAVRAADVGVYTCAVTSPGGNETRSARLSVIELPFSPVNIHATRLESVSQRAVNVSWTPGFDGNSPTLKFIVQRREVSDLGNACLCTCTFLFYSQKHFGAKIKVMLNIVLALYICRLRSSWPSMFCIYKT
jgi:hypothetical protein